MATVSPGKPKKLVDCVCDLLGTTVTGVVKADGLVAASCLVIADHADRLERLVHALAFHVLEQEAAAHDHLGVHCCLAFH